MASVRKARWTYKGKVRETWVVDYTDETGKRRRRTPKSGLRKDAELIRQRVEQELKDGLHTAASQTMTMARLAEEYERNMEDRRKDGAIGRGYVQIVSLSIRSTIVPALGNRKLTELSGNDLGVMMRHMRDKGLAIFTMKERRRILLSMEAFAVRRGYTKRRALFDARADYPVGRAPKIKIPSKDQMLKLLEVAEVRFHRQHHRTARLVRLKVHLAAFCGLRYGEICGLKIDSVDFDARSLRIRHSVTRFGEVKAPKSESGNRDVPMPAHIAGWLKDWIENDYVDNPDKLLLTNEGGQSMRSTQWHVAHWQKLLARAGMRTKEEGSAIHFHALRHFAGSWWIENDLPVPLVSTLLGHADANVTMQIYAHSLKTRDERWKAVGSATDALLALRGGDKSRENSANLLISQH